MEKHEFHFPTWRHAARPQPAAGDNRVCIRVRDLHVSFGAQTVLNGLSLDVYKGEVLGFVGASGMGKSVLTRTILGLDHKQAGSIEVFGSDLDALSIDARARIERRFGVMFQQGALFSGLTVKQNVQLPLREHLKISDRLADELALLKIALVGLAPDAAEKYPSELSGGMIKRAALARALALDPELVFLDEPTSGLDPIGAAEFDELIGTLQKTLGLTVFMVTHDLDSLYSICDRVAALADGKVVAAGPIAAMLQCQHPWVKSYFQGERARRFNASNAKERQPQPDVAAPVNRTI
jgi:phospholipid/cholesterol/gamma-HCH transport system ATP-binding protein